MMTANSGLVTDLTTIAALCAAAAGGILAGRAAVALDARMSRVTQGLSAGTLAAGAAGLALAALACANARDLTLAGCVGLALVAFGAAFLRGAVRIVAAEERREQVTVRVALRRRAASRRRPAA